MTVAREHSPCFLTDYSSSETDTSTSSVFSLSKKDSVIDCSPSLLSDYWNLYESGNYTDLSIHVGRESKSKIFLVHSLVFCARSKYFANRLTGNTETSKEIQKTA